MERPLSGVRRRKATIARTAYYDRIAKQWHRVTGHHGGAFKRYVLNDRILAHIEGIEELAILEVGAGNGYFAPLLLRRFSGQIPARLVISDQSPAQLAIAHSAFAIDGAEYLALDVQEPFPFEDACFDLILALMVLNELTASGLQSALGECRRVLTPRGRLLAAVPHPLFVRAGEEGRAYRLRSRPLCAAERRRSAPARLAPASGGVSRRAACLWLRGHHRRCTP